MSTATDTPHSRSSSTMATPQPSHQAALQAAIRNNLLSTASPVAAFYNLADLRSNIASLLAAFPSSSLHAFALKAAPFPRLLRHLHAAGLGGECASIAELALCKAAAIPPAHTVYDSPAKTDPHLREALREGVHINADNVHELRRIDALVNTVVSGSSVGLRVNPQLGSASIAETFTAAAACKFGEPLRERRDAIVQAFVKYPFLTAIMVHVGSQGCELDVLVEGAAAAVELAGEIRAAGGNVEIIDIGGGISVDYWGDSEIAFEQLAAMLRKRCPGLFEYKIMTEFGRRMVAKTGFIAGRVESVKESGGKTYVICHIGADVLMRPAYVPKKWGHRIEVYDSEGEAREGRTGKVEIGGPLCFSGDIIARDREMVIPNVGDWIVVRDAGAYTVAMYSRHTSQLVPPVYGVDGGEFEVIKKGETVDDVVKFWS